MTTEEQQPPQQQEEKGDKGMASQAESPASGNDRGREVLEDKECPQEVKDAYVEGQRGK